MSGETVTIEVDGQPLEARKGAMLIEVTDDAGIYIPRFCYHKKLSIAANCRMCLVEVERAPKPLPACATPVMDGMKVFTRSAKAVAAQQSTMEFLLINHPLDCPVCDQGGECELQDLAVGYGSDVSRYTERKRVVRDKDIGPLVQTDMTRCIHCTRCVRFGEEIAGLRELGATGRGEHTEIGTYVEKAMTSELSGNVIDLCPVGALTSRPYRFSARAWELRQFDGIAAHDCLGSNVHIHARGSVVKRVVPKENEGVNETWISDRDRFSYEGLRSNDRLLRPRVRRDGAWHEISWEEAFETAAASLKSAVEQHGAHRLGALSSATATVEECYYLQGLLRGLGSDNIDHRLRQADFSDQHVAPAYPWLGQTFDEFEQSDVIVIIGGNPRHDQPLLNHRLRRSVARGGRVVFLNSRRLDLNFDATQRVVRPGAMPGALVGIARALNAAGADRLLNTVEADETETAIAQVLRSAGKVSVVLGLDAHSHPQFATLRGLAGLICTACNGTLGYLTDGPNGAGAALAGALPHRLAGGKLSKNVGMDAREMSTTPLSAYLLLGFDPDLDCWDSRKLLASLTHAEHVIALSAYLTPVLEKVCTLLLPIAGFAENEGSYVNAAGMWQSFSTAVRAPGEARPAWKVLRMLADRLGIEGMKADAVDQIAAEVRSASTATVADTRSAFVLPESIAAPSTSEFDRITVIPMYGADSLVRRAAALRKTPFGGHGELALHPEALARLGVEAGDMVWITQDDIEVQMRVQADETVPDGVAGLYAAQPGATNLGPMSGPVVITAGSRG